MRAWRGLAVASVIMFAAQADAFWPCGGCCLIPPPEHTAERAGNPQCISKCAVPGRSCKDAVGYVGGGCLGGHGDCRGALDGTFGYDYAGCLWNNPGRVFLRWCHCRDCQPERGPYKTDGPHVPDVFSLRPIKRCCDKKTCDD
jgi:hypothetical protein